MYHNTARSHDFYKIPFGHRNSCKIPFPLSNVFGKTIQLSQIERREPGIPRKFSNFRKCLNGSQLCKGKLPMLRCTFLNALTWQHRNFPYRQSFKLAALMADFVRPAISPTSNATDERAAMRWSVVCCLLLAVCVSTCMEACVRVKRLDQRKMVPIGKDAQDMTTESWLHHKTQVPSGWFR